MVVLEDDFNRSGQSPGEIADDLRESRSWTMTRKVQPNECAAAARNRSSAPRPLCVWLQGGKKARDDVFLSESHNVAIEIACGPPLESVRFLPLHDAVARHLHRHCC